jgi:phosphomannomutase
MMTISIQQLMDESEVKFGTSGVRGLATDMTDRVCYVYSKGFIQHLEAGGDLRSKGSEVAVAGDLRPSTDRIMEAVCQAVEDMGYAPVNCGRIPSPAVALYGFVKSIPAVMVTGSHIPADRNGIKFNKCGGEILKQDEEGIRHQTVQVADDLFDASGAFVDKSRHHRQVRLEAQEAYVARYLDVFPPIALKGKRIGVYQHSAVGRELLARILNGLGAETITLGFADEFVPVDTEAIRSEDVRLAREWAQCY